MGPLAVGLALGAAFAQGGCGSPEQGTIISEASGGFEAPVRSEDRAYRIEKLPPAQLRLSGAATSLDGLLQALEVALAERDTARLLDLMINEREYRHILYPALPAAHPPINAGFETLWVTHFPDAYRGLMRLLGAYGGRVVRILEVRFDRPDQDYVNYRLHEMSHVDAEVDGVREDNLRLFGSVVRVGDQWKVLSYPDD